jgi:hypothetical protein
MNQTHIPVTCPCPRPYLALSSPHLRQTQQRCGLLFAFLFAGVLLFWHTPVAQAAACTGSAITGLAFRDYNANGVRETAEPGLASIVVTAYDAAGTTAS